MNTAAATRTSINFSADASAEASTSATQFGIALLRIALGAMFLAHGLLKVLVFTLPGTAGFFESVGFPGFLAYVVVPAEVLAGVALLAGFRTRLVAPAAIPVLVGGPSGHLWHRLVVQLGERRLGIPGLSHRRRAGAKPDRWRRLRLRQSACPFGLNPANPSMGRLPRFSSQGVAQ